MSGIGSQRAWVDDNESLFRLSGWLMRADEKIEEIR